MIFLKAKKASWFVYSLWKFATSGPLLFDNTFLGAKAGPKRLSKHCKHENTYDEFVKIMNISETFNSCLIWSNGRLK